MIRTPWAARRVASSVAPYPKRSNINNSNDRVISDTSPPGWTMLSTLKDMTLRMVGGEGDLDYVCTRCSLVDWKSEVDVANWTRPFECGVGLLIQVRIASKRGTGVNNCRSDKGGPCHREFPDAGQHTTCHIVLCRR